MSTPQQQHHVNFVFMSGSTAPLKLGMDDRRYFVNQASTIYPQFRFVEFSKVRQMRGAEAARIEIVYAEGDHDEIWMSAGELHGNIRQFGEHEALTEALKAYGQGGRG